MPKNNKKEHFDFEVDFLDNAAHDRPKKMESSDSESGSTSSGSNLKPIVITIAIVIGLSVLAGIFGEDSNNSSSSSSSSYSTTNYGNTGDYSCSSYYSNKADEIKPSESTKQQLDEEGTELENRMEELNQSSTDIDNMYVNEYSQASIDSYNNKVNAHNTKLEQYDIDYSSYETRFNEYNAGVDAYNNFLKTNCSKY